MPLSRHGFWELIIGTVLLAGLAAGLGWLWWPLAFLPLPVLVWLFAFFRDPNRVVPGATADWVSPADGTVSDIGVIEADEHLGGPVLRIGIFLSVFNVHVNRSPCDGVVIKSIYKKGKFINALHHATASSDNESNTLVIADRSTNRPIATVRQIVGLIARRIICEPDVGAPLARGQRIGLIKFGSRTELSVPMWLNPEAKVKVGDKVCGALTILCTVAESQSAATPPVATAGAKA
ncbi:MAG TPA: phosphatidylserine decarboxylase [Tepidisphaeraceae bacterium]|nr:phosphatidylserine decarboxylase [Tepidisphaeraceae bacterium]